MCEGYKLDGGNTYKEMLKEDDLCKEFVKVTDYMVEKVAKKTSYFNNDAMKCNVVTLYNDMLRKWRRLYIGLSNNSIKKMDVLLGRSDDGDKDVVKFQDNVITQVKYVREILVDLSVYAIFMIIYFDKSLDMLLKKFSDKVSKNFKDYSER
jgi:hypothetical protein